MKITSLMAAAAVTLAVLLVSSQTWAKDVYGNQISFRGDAGSTYQAWQFTSPQQSGIVPEDYMNPYGTPLADVLGSGAEWRDDWPVPPGLEPGGDVPGWHMPLGGTVIHLLHNDPRPNAQKIIIAQVTSSKEPSSVALELPPGFSYSMFDPGFPTVEWGTPAPFDGSWSTYVYGFQIVGNPEWESIQIDYPPCTTLDQTILDSICVPEPATTALLAAGLGTLLARRRRA
jgi:hypothetical protein